MEKRKLGRPKKTEETANRRKQVRDLFHKGYTPEQIAEKIGANLDKVRRDYSLLERGLRTGRIKTLEEKRKRYIRDLKEIQRKAWEIAEDAKHKDKPTIQASLLRIAKDAVETMAKVEGIISEKAPIAPDKRAVELQEKLRKIADKGSGGDGHKEDKEEIADAIADS